MTESSLNNEYMEAFPLPEGSILLEAGNNSQSLRQLTIAALRKVISDRKLELPRGPHLDLDNHKRLLNLNRFFIQDVTFHQSSELVKSIKSNRFFNKIAYPACHKLSLNLIKIWLHFCFKINQNLIKNRTKNDVEFKIDLVDF